MSNVGRNATAATQGFFDSLSEAFRGGPAATFRFFFQTRQGLFLTLGGTAAIIALIGINRRRNSIRGLERQGSFEGQQRQAPAGNLGVKRTSNREDADIDNLIRDLHSTNPSTVGRALADVAQFSSDKKYYNIFQEREVAKLLLTLLDEQARVHSHPDTQTNNNREDLLNLLKSLNNLASYSGRVRLSIADGASNFIKIIQQGNAKSNASSSPSQSNNKILDNAFRVLMHLSVDQAMEIKIGDLNGIPPVLEVMDDKTTDVAVSLQACRLLINLSFNEDNKRIIVENRGIPIITELLHKNVLEWSLEKNPEQKAKLEEYVSKLIREMGFLAKCPGISVDNFKGILSDHLSRAIGEVLEAKASDDKDAANVVSATGTIVKEAKALLAKAEGGDAFAQEYKRWLKALKDRSVEKNLDKFRTEKIKSYIDNICSALDEVSN